MIKISRALSQEESVAKVSAPTPGAPPEQDQPASQAAPTPRNPRKVPLHHFAHGGDILSGAQPRFPSFIEIGEEVKKSQTLCIIEAMKLMNEIESDVDGIVAEIYVENGKPVEYGQRLFAIQPVAA